MEDEYELDYEAKKRAKNKVDFEEEKLNYPKETQFYDRLIADEDLPENPDWEVMLATNLAVIR